ncbi:hypothetical protein OH76DRAFT_1423591 [Lentinus brumalis]|uniref:Uncharacterized protein n=1 Tax=Lentinus brumalis TaxID=2498619 RepID=A0A371CK30_9APHY|nr:hypothetical protein OH76DRAFT_1423591 [Polyporus brumalis]
MMKDPDLPAQIVLSVAQWSLDHRVFTLSLLRRGAVHRRHVEMLNRYYTLMHLMSTTQEKTSGSEGVTVQAGEFGHDPRYHPALAAISILAKEEASHKPADLDSDRTLKLWDDALSWCVGLLSSQPGLAIALDLQLCKTQVSYLRCAEYDAVLRSESEGLVQMPHVGLFDLILRHTALMGTEASAMADEMSRVRRARLDSDKMAAWQNAGREIDRASESARFVRDEVEFLCDLLDDKDSPRAKDFDPQDVAKDEVEKLKARVQRYPVGGFVDAGIFVAIDGILDGLQSDMSPDDSQAFLRDISFLVGSSTPQDAPPAGSTAAEPNASRHILHLPVLLVNHQVHECGLDDSTRNKQRLNCVSAAQFLAALGIKDFPVYGLATSGQYGYVCSTWYSSEDSRMCDSASTAPIVIPHNIGSMYARTAWFASLGSSRGCVSTQKN